MVESGGGLLAGLVSAEASALYLRLVESGGLRIGTGPDEVDLASAAARELLDARIAWRSSTDTDRVLAVSEVRALQLLLAQHHADMVQRQQHIMQGWERLDAFLPSAIEPGSAGSSDSESLVEIIRDRDTISRLSAELYQSARKELLGTSIGVMSVPMHDLQLVTPPEPSIGRGARFRMIYDTAFATDSVGRRIVEASISSGEEARIRGDVPIKMLHVDDRVALVALTPTGIDGAMLVHSPSLLSAMRQWFELLWTDTATTTVDGTAHTSLTAAQVTILRLLASGKSDEAIARASNSSVRTVRRHISAIMELLDVTSRFAAGAVAAKRGWI